jgi:hypothetical protein
MSLNCDNSCTVLQALFPPNQVELNRTLTFVDYLCKLHAYFLCFTVELLHKIATSYSYHAQKI